MSGPNDASPIRRSGRSRKANAKYSSVGWNKETLRLLRESSESSNPTSADTDSQPEISDEEFDEHISQAPSNAAAGVDDDQLSIASGSSKSSRVATPGGNGDDGDDGDDASVIRPGSGRRAARKPGWKQSVQLHSRGIVAAERSKSARAGVWQIMFGPEVEDLTPMALAKDFWLHNTRDVTLPSYKTTLEYKKHGFQGGVTNSKRPNSELHDHVDSSSPENSQVRSLAFSETQKLEPITIDEARKRFLLTDGIGHKIVMGPWSQQQQYDLPYLKPISIGQAWRKRGDPSGSSYHSGWSINVGEKPLHMAWSPRTVQAQYLALTCRSTPEQRSSAPKVETIKTPAFSPSAGYPNSIQIWKFATMTGQSTGSTMRHDIQPTLVAVVVCNYGDVKQMSWKSDSFHDDDVSTIGTLALVTSDGYFRLIHIPGPKDDAQDTEYFEIISPALQIEPLVDGVFTCFTFASPCDVILGASSGYIHIYNISQMQNSGEKLEPYFSFQLHHTYVMALCTIPEEEHSHFLASASASGAFQITDLRSPTQDVVTIARARIATRNLICNAQTRTFMTTIDSSGNTEPRGNAQTTIVGHNLRHFYSSMSLSKYPEGSGTATTLAGSTLHPCILMGNTGGTVWAQNVVRRIMPTGKPGAKNDGGAWVQKVVEYEWIPDPSLITDDKTKDKADLHHGAPTRPGISRLHHGFKPERLDLSNAGSKKRKAPASGLNGDSAIQVIYEDEHAVTALAWNENPLASTWCALGWGSGVILVMDLGHDTK